MEIHRLHNWPIKFQIFNRPIILAHLIIFVEACFQIQKIKPSEVFLLLEKDIDKKGKISKMACNSVTCQSGCYRDEYSVDEDDQKRRSVPVNGEGSNNASPHRGDSNGHGVCIKCKVNETIAATHPAVAGGGGDGGRFCADCFRSNLFGKFRFAVTSNAMISPSDNVLVAFSGGSSSRYSSIYVFVSV